MPAIQTTAPKRSVRSRQPLKRATNVTLSADVLDAAKALELNISQVCDNHLRQMVTQDQWRTF